ncbi:AaceriAAR022Wp [[Ashbya] aceris (nom. inval.)]|nr:AaceriAAR022Wp [[Ashbya] aceris (nom. inval.)]
MTEEPATKKKRIEGRDGVRTSPAADEPGMPRNTLYVSNLNDQIKSNTLKTNLYLLFSTFGEVVKIAMSPKLRGQAFVVLSTVDEANLAMISLKDESFFGKPLRIQFSKSDMKEV